MAGLSLRQYSSWRKERGLEPSSLGAIQKAKAKEILVLDSAGKVLPAESDKLWAANTDTMKSHPGKTKPGGGAAEEKGTKQSGYIQASTMVKTLDAQMRTLKLREMSGSLVNRDAANDILFRFARQIRDTLQAWPAQIASELADDLTNELKLPAGHEIDGRTVLITLEKYVHRVLTDISENPVPTVDN